MNIDIIQNGIVIDHIKAKNGMAIYNYLNLKDLECSVAIMTNVRSQKMGKKDIIKIDKNINVDMDIIGFLDENVTINIINKGKIIEKKKVDMPEKIKNIVKCQNPRCITNVEREIDQIFNLTNGKYRCKYCESSLDFEKLDKLC